MNEMDFRGPRRHRVFESALGRFAIVQEPDGALWSRWLDDEEPPADSLEDRKLLPDVFERLDRYFAGEAADFSDIPTPAGPPFHQRCWEACRRIPRGETRTYRELAIAAGSGANGARAAGQAMRRNPLCVIVPCHRVVATSGGLGGFAGSTETGGVYLRLKERLLELEGALRPIA